MFDSTPHSSDTDSTSERVRPSAGTTAAQPSPEPTSAALSVGYGRLRGSVALVAGGGGGIGRAIASLFVLEGARVLVADLPNSDAKQVAQSLGAAADYADLDVRDPAQWRRAVDLCHTRFGAPPDVLVLSSGFMVCAPVDKVTEDEMTTAYAINTIGPVLGIQAVAPGMRQAGRGSIVVVTSLGGVSFGVPGMAPYVMSKAALGAVVKCAALDFAGTGIRVNNIAPGQIDTPMSRNSGVSADAEFLNRMPIPRMGQPRDIAGAALFLASEESSWMTGSTVSVDGGMEAGPSL